ncbi:MAG: nucleic acid-binding protein [Planctomycetaceae bacterium]|nr:nucleic acid-binding protein [Planctomycetaceae bacterium]
MTISVLDTDSLTLFLRGEETISARIASTSPDSIAVSIVTVEEVLTGWYAEVRRARQDDQLVRAYLALQQSIEFFRFVRILPFNEAAVHLFRELRRQYRRLGTNDLRIAAISMVHQGVIITRNQRDFGVIEGLSTDDWSFSPSN